MEYEFKTILIGRMVGGGLNLHEAKDAAIKDFQEGIEQYVQRMYDAYVEGGANAVMELTND